MRRCTEDTNERKTEDEEKERKKWYVSFNKSVSNRNVTRVQLKDINFMGKIDS